MPCRRCSLCSMHWPDTTDYSKCPQCEEPTDRFHHTAAMDKAEALSLKRHAEFERYLENREAG